MSGRRVKTGRVCKPCAPAGAVQPSQAEMYMYLGPKRKEIVKDTVSESFVKLKETKHFHFYKEENAEGQDIILYRREDSNTSFNYQFDRMQKGGSIQDKGYSDIWGNRTADTWPNAILITPQNIESLKCKDAMTEYLHNKFESAEDDSLELYNRKINELKMKNEDDYFGPNTKEFQSVKVFQETIRTLLGKFNRENLDKKIEEEFERLLEKSSVNESREFKISARPLDQHFNEFGSEILKWILLDADVKMLKSKEEEIRREIETAAKAEREAAAGVANGVEFEIDDSESMKMNISNLKSKSENGTKDVYLKVESSSPKLSWNHNFFKFQSFNSKDKTVVLQKIDGVTYTGELPQGQIVRPLHEMKWAKKKSGSDKANAGAGGASEAKAAKEEQKRQEEEERKRQGAVDATPAFDLATPRTVASLSNLKRQIGDEADRAYNIKIYHTKDERMSEEFLKVFNNDMKNHSVENWNANYSDTPSADGGMLHDFLTWHNTERRKEQGNDERPVYKQDLVRDAWDIILEYTEEKHETFDGVGSRRKKEITTTTEIKYPHVWIAVLTSKTNQKPVGFCQINAEKIKGNKFLMDLDKLWIAKTSRGVSGLSLELCLLTIQKAFFDQEYEFEQIYASVINENLIALNFFLKSMNMMFGFTKLWIKKPNPTVTELRKCLLQEAGKSEDYCLIANLWEDEEGLHVGKDNYDNNESIEQIKQLTDQLKKVKWEAKSDGLTKDNLKKHLNGTTDGGIPQQMDGIESRIPSDKKSKFSVTLTKSQYFKSEVIKLSNNKDIFGEIPIEK